MIEYSPEYVRTKLAELLADETISISDTIYEALIEPYLTYDGETVIANNIELNYPWNDTAFLQLEEYSRYNRQGYSTLTIQDRLTDNVYFVFLF